MKNLTFAIASCCLWWIISSPSAWAETAFKDLAYVTNASPHQKLDIFLPKEPGKNEKFPLVLFIHGGGWLFGDKADVPKDFLLKNGYAVASINYRPYTVAPNPAQIMDSMEALRWLRKNADKYHLDHNNITSFGVSAGGHLAAMLGAAPSRPGLLQSDTRVNKVIAIAAPLNLASLRAQSRTKVAKHFASDKGPLAGFLGRSPRKAVNIAVAASPITYLDDKVPPFLIVHGVFDELIPKAQAEEFYKVLQPLSGDSQLILLPGGHGLFQPVWEQQVVQFLKNHVANKGSTKG